jgi:mannose-6-phosphate isomerase-like protein (cupin superfamily)
MTQQLVAEPMPLVFSRRVPKPWGYEVVFTPSTLPYAGKLLHVLGGHRLSLQVHDEKTETLILLSGVASLSIEDELGTMSLCEMEPGVGYTVLAGRKHRLAATADSVILEASTPEAGVTLRLEDDYGRPDEHTSR